MRVTVKLFATFRIGRFKVEERELPDRTLCRQVVADLNLTDDEIGIVMINGRHGMLDQELQPGDVLSLFPLVGGG